MKTANVLEIDGGGIRGVAALVQLIEFERLLKKPIKEHFDLITGTSTGAIVAVLLSVGYSTEDILNLYTVHGEKIFQKSFFRKGWFRPKYDDAYFNKILLQYTKSLTLKDCKTDVLIPAYNITKKEGKLFKSKKAKEDGKDNYTLFEVIRSSASAQSFFKPIKIGEDEYIDGGMYVNNPSVMALLECLKDGYEKINIISFSTGEKRSLVSRKILDGGILNWAEPTVDILLAEGAELADYTLETMYPLVSNLLGRRLGIYIRCKSLIVMSSGKIDDASEKNISNMIDDGETSAKMNKDLMRAFYLNTLNK
jgi:patatin-like phospholipase/acyl hydrolase